MAFPHPTADTSQTRCRNKMRQGPQGRFYAPGQWTAAAASDSSRVVDPGHHIWGQVEDSGSSSFDSLPRLPRAGRSGDECRNPKSPHNKIGGANLTGVTFLESSNDSNSSGNELGISSFEPERGRDAPAVLELGTDGESNGDSREGRACADNEIEKGEKDRMGASSSSINGMLLNASRSKAVAKRHPTLAALNMSRFTSGDGRVAVDSGQWSKGSMLHAAGKCKPCAWSWKPGGCSEGADCTFCHTCDEAAHRQYKKDRLASLKLSRESKKTNKAGKAQAQAKSGSVFMSF